MKIQKLIIDSTDCKSDLCSLGALIGTDKSPYNERAHRHPYTAVYSLLFSRFQTLPVRFAEIGIAMGHSIVMWRAFFQNLASHIFAFDSCEITRRNLDSLNLPGVSSHHMDVSDEASIEAALQSIGGNLDVLLDDSSHNFGHQTHIIRRCIPFLKSGGMLVIEDVFRSHTGEMFENALGSVLDHFSFGCMIVTEHANRYSPGWDNDQILVLVKK
jgi:hypothetical protein